MLLQELLNTSIVTVLYAIAFIVQLSVWSTPYNSHYRSSNIAAGVSSYCYYTLELYS